MLEDHIEGHWIDSFQSVFELCKVDKSQTAIILTETQSRPVNRHLTELALTKMGVTFFHLEVPTPPLPKGPIVRSSGTCMALAGQVNAVEALAKCDFIVDLTLEGLMHAKETATILKGGARIMNISNEHPEALARLVPEPEMKDRVKQALTLCRSAKSMRVTSKAGTDLSVNLEGAANVGVWGWTDRPGTLAHWPAGIIVSFPKAGSTQGKLVFQPGDMNLTFKRYFDSEVTFQLKDDFVQSVEGSGPDAALMRKYLADFDDPNAYATSHVGWGLNHLARYEALTMYDQRETNCTELRAVAGNFLYSTGANEFAGRFTRGHFDLPMMNCTIELDGQAVVDNGRVV